MVRHSLKAALVGGILATVLVACAPQAARETQPPAASPRDTGWSIPEGREHLRLDAAASTLQVRVQRGGRLARLGHNHVLRAAGVEGRAWLPSAPGRADAGAELRIPVARFVVDDAIDRAAAGPDFAEPVPDEAREATRGNLLRAEVLDAERFPWLRLRAGGEPGAATWRAEIEVRGARYPLDLPLRWIPDGTAYRVEGEILLRQTELGMTPFSVGGGAIAVRDELEIHYRLRFARESMLPPATSD